MNAWIKAFRVIPEFRILSMTFHRIWKVMLKMLYYGDYVSFLFTFSLAKDSCLFKLEIVNI